MQLNLLYEQAKEQILEGTHPVEIEKAITFAAYQVIRGLLHFLLADLRLENITTKWRNINNGGHILLIV